MKEIFSTYVLTAVGALFVNLLFVHTLGGPSDYHGIRTFMFASFLLPHLFLESIVIRARKVIGLLNL